MMVRVHAAYMSSPDQMVICFIMLADMWSLLMIK